MRPDGPTLMFSAIDRWNIDGSLRHMRDRRTKCLLRDRIDRDASDENAPRLPSENRSMSLVSVVLPPPGTAHEPELRTRRNAQRQAVEQARAAGACRNVTSFNRTEWSAGVNGTGCS